MVIYERIAEIAMEVGCTPDFVLEVGFWLVLNFGILIMAGSILVVSCFLKRKHSAPASHAASS